MSKKIDYWSEEPIRHFSSVEHTVAYMRSFYRQLRRGIYKHIQYLSFLEVLTTYEREGKLYGKTKNELYKLMGQVIKRMDEVDEGYRILKEKEKRQQQADFFNLTIEELDVFEAIPMSQWTERQRAMPIKDAVQELMGLSLTKEEYRALARENHPDFAVDEVDRTKREEKMKELNSRYRRVA